MRIHFLPAEQQKRNDRVVEKLNRMGYVLFFLAVTTVTLGARIYLWPPPRAVGPQIVSADGHIVLGDAIVVAPDLVLCAAKISDPVQYVAGRESIPARKVKSAAISDSTDLVLLRLEIPSSVPPVVAAVAGSGEVLHASSGGQEWQGTVEEAADTLKVTPEFSLPPGVAVVRQADSMAIAGVSAQAGNKTAIIPAKTVFSRFPELGQN